MPGIRADRMKNRTAGVTHRVDLDDRTSRYTVCAEDGREWLVDIDETGTIVESVMTWQGDALVAVDTPPWLPDAVGWVAVA